MRKRVSLQLRYIEIYARGAAGEQAIDEAADLAKGFGDAHEISAPNPPGGRLMDLYNNNTGRKLAVDPANKGRSAEDVVLEAIKNGQAQPQPFKTRSTPPPGISLRRKSPSRYR